MKKNSDWVNLDNSKLGPAIDPKDLQFFCEAIGRRAGINMKSSKQDLVKTRLRSRLAANSFSTYGEYRSYLSSLPADHKEWQEFTNILTTNKTDFFREPKHFQFLTEKILPEWLATGNKVFKVWSAASSSGEEAYTLAMVLHRHLPEGRDFRILATDIDTEILSAAKNAVYSGSKKPEIPLDYANSIQMGHGEAKGWFRIHPELKSRVQFKQHNLIDKTAPSDEVFDLVLCRNVLIYFNKENIDFVQRKLHSTTKVGGHLFIGHSESLQGIKHSWQPAGPSVFKKAG